MLFITESPRRRTAPPTTATGAEHATAQGGHSTARPPQPRRGPLKRALLGCLVVLLCSAGASATFVLEEVHNLRDALSQNAPLSLGSGTLTPAGWGDPQTLLLVGDDQRSLTGAFKYYSRAVLPHSNEMLLVRIDPSKPYVSMMSIPRELETTVYPPGQAPVTTRFNYAYTAGGIPLLVSTIKRVLGLSVNHVMVITFGRFKRAVDRMGCVYSTVDRRYYHVNEPGGEQYQEINLQPGYQEMCGTQALEFVSYRHDDTSLIRDARDQSFLLDVKKQYGPTLADNINEFEGIFGQAVQTDSGLHSTTGLLNLIGTLISSSGRRVRQVQFQANLTPTDPTAVACSCVTATQQQIAASVHSFLYGGSALPRQRMVAIAHAVHNSNAVAQLPLAAVGASELTQARTAAGNMPFAYEYPRVQDRGGAGGPVFLREYQIHAPDGSAYPIYVAVFSAGQVGEYYDVQGTTWTTPPVLDSPEQTVQVAGRTYYLYYQGQTLNLVAWHEHGAAYWIRNSLTNTVPNGELLAIAEQTRPVGPTGGGGPRARVNLRSAAVPTQTRQVAGPGLRQTLGSLSGLLGLLTIPALGIPLLRRRRDLADLRSRQRVNSHRERSLVAALGGVGVRQTASLGAEPSSTAGNGLRTTTYGRQHRVPHPAVVLGSSVVLVLGLLGVFVASEGARSAATGGSHHHRPAASAKRVDTPSVPVAVLNDTSTTGAARRLAEQLRSRGVKVSGVGNLPESRAPGLWILYGPGEREQAALLSRLLANHAPTVAPLDPTAEAAAGSTARLVVVIA